jgi:putative transposase
MKPNTTKLSAASKKGRDALLAFYDFPAEHWETFADHESDRKYVRDRPSSNHPLEGMKSWRRLDGHHQLSKIILGVRFTDGIEVVKPKAQAAAA